MTKSNIPTKYHKWLARLQEAQELPMVPHKKKNDSGSLRLKWETETPQHGGVYAFWWDGAGKSSLNNLATQKLLHFKAPGGAKISLDVTQLISRRLENGLIPLYVGKSFENIAKRIRLHLCLDSARVVAKTNCKTASPRKTTTCQLRDRLDRLFPNVRDTRQLLKNVRVSWVELCGKGKFSERFFLEDLAIGLFRPAFNIDSER